MIVVFDLDDTLYDEIDFVKSGFKEIANYLKNDLYYDYMLDIFNNEGSGKVFNKLIEKYDLKISLPKLIEIYRFHLPNIQVPDDSKELLEFTKKYETALISDGHYIMQKNKFNMLQLNEFIRYPVFTDYHHTTKPEQKPYKLVMDKFKNEEKFIYISDNPKKDFIAVKELGWIGIRYKNPVGIYRTIKNSTDYEVHNRKDIINILKVLDGK